MHAVGFGTAYNAFSRELSTFSPATFTLPGASVAAWPGVPDDGFFQMAGVAGNYPVWVSSNSGTISDVDSDASAYPLTSAPDLAMQSSPSKVLYAMVAFADNVTLNYYNRTNGYGGGGLSITSLAPPSSTTFSYSPTTCDRPSPSTDNDYTRHIAAVAGAKLYYAHSVETDPVDTPTFSAWEQAGNVTPASSPDCVVTSDNTLHIVVLTSTGTIAHLYRTGVSGSWTTQDLGAF
jgi:hypothetical protein